MKDNIFTIIKKIIKFKIMLVNKILNKKFFNKIKTKINEIENKKNLILK